VSHALALQELRIGIVFSTRLRIIQVPAVQDRRMLAAKKSDEVGSRKEDLPIISTHTGEAAAGEAPISSVPTS
jgi:hypothetical protein